MKFIELQEAFEIELNVLDDGLNKPKSMDTEWWLNRGLEKFWKTRYSGMNTKSIGFEQDQKRIDDLRTLVKTVSIIPTKVTNKQYSIDIPNDYVILLGDTVGIQPSDDSHNACWEVDEDGEFVTKYSDTIESSIETIDRQLSNSLSEHILKYCSARPLKLIQGNSVYLYTDGQYKISDYQLTYLRNPEKINIHLNPFDEYVDMPEHTHSEIVKIAAQMYIENQSNQRVNTHNAEVQEME
jgi:hypothetical protein